MGRFAVQAMMVGVLTFLSGCARLAGADHAVKVEETVQEEEGVWLEDLPTTSESIAVEGARFEVVTNDEIARTLEAKIPATYSKLRSVYQEAISRSASLSLFPELNVVYRFKAKWKDGESPEVQFPLHEVFAGGTLVLRILKGKVIPYWGQGKTAGLNWFGVSENSYFGYEAASGGKFFSLRFSPGKFAFDRIAASLPIASKAAHVTSKRVDVEDSVIAELGMKKGGRVFFYSDEHRKVTRIFFMNAQFIFKEWKGSCEMLEKVGFLEEGFHCSGKSVADRTGVSVRS